jgi:hypothetical protein
VVFEDVYQAVVYGIEEQLTGEVRSSVLAFWHSFVEPFFGRGERAYVQLHTKTELQQLEAEEHADKQSSSSSDEEEGKKGERACAHAFVCVFWGGGSAGGGGGGGAMAKRWPCSPVWATHQRGAPSLVRTLWR